MHLTGGAVVIILILGVCAAAAIYFTVKSYLITRRDPFADDGDPELPKSAETEERTAPSKGEREDGRDVPPPTS